MRQPKVGDSGVLRWLGRAGGGEEGGMLGGSWEAQRRWK